MLELQENLVGVFDRIRYFNLGCHGIPDRCFIIRGKRMKTCARCVGAMFGHIVSFILFLVGHLLPLYIASILTVIMLIDWSLQTFIDIPSTNPRRLITGFIGGLGVGTFIWTGVGWLIYLLNR